MSRAFIFTMDAALALIPVFIAMGTLSALSGSETVLMQARMMDTSHRADDTIAVLEKQETLDDFGKMFANYSKLKSDGDSTWQNEQNNLMMLVNTTVGLMVPEYLGYAVEFWGNYPNGTEYIDMEFTTDNRTFGGVERPYENESGNIVSATKMISGYEKERPIKGCVARAELQSISKTTTDVISFNIQGSGWGTDNVEIEKTFGLPSDASVTNATFYLSIHYYNLDSLEVNGVDIRSRITWLHQESSSTGYGYFGVADVTDLISTGNVVEVVMSNSPFHAHIHPGMRLEITYETAQSQSTSMTQRFYFDNTIGRTGAWQVQDFYVPEDAVVSSATLYLHGEGIDAYYLVEVNENTIDECSSSCSSTYDATWNIESYIQDGTNLVSVFLDSYANNEYGSGTAEISNSSYVEIQYAYLPMTTHGYIDLTEVLQFGGSLSNPKETNFFIPSTRSLISESFAHMAQIYSWTVRLQAWAEGDSPTTVFDSPNPRAVPVRIFIEPSILESNETNYVRGTDTGCGGCDFLPESIIEYTYLIPNSVPFGNAFEVCDGHQHTVYYDTDADGIADGSTVVRPSLPTGFNPDDDGEDDAFQRLLDELNFYVNESNSGRSGTVTNPIDVELIDVDFEIGDIGEVPFMWGPLKIRIRIWW